MDYINTIISGTVVFKLGRKYIYVKPASAKDKTFADFFAKEQYDDSILDGIWTQEDAERHLLSMGYLSGTEDKEMEDIKEVIENMKVDYFNSFYSNDTKEYIKRNIEKQEKRFGSIHIKKYLFFDKTCDYLKNFAFVSYLLQKNAFLNNGKLACNYFSIQKMYRHYTDVVNDINLNTRALSKTDEWRIKWNGLKAGIFDNRKSTLTDFQFSVLSWSNYYDSIYKSYDRPSESVIDDDIALDGWGIKERRRRKAEEKKKNAEKMLPANMKDAGEIFIPARNASQAEDIMSLNDAAGIAQIKSLKKDLAASSSVDVAELTSTRMELGMKAAEMSKNKRRK
jgi:hypothetical protein